MGLGRAGQPADCHGSGGIASLARPLAPVARNSDYPTAPEHWSYTGNVQEGHMGPELGDDSCSGHEIPQFYFVFEAVKGSSVCAPHVATPRTTAPADRGWKNSITKLVLGVLWFFVLPCKILLV